MGLNIVLSVKVFEAEKDLEEQHTGTNDKNSFLKEPETDSLVGHTATGAPSATLKAILGICQNLLLSICSKKICGNSVKSVTKVEVEVLYTLIHG